MNWLISTWMKSTANCDISELKMDALLTILSKSSCFPDQTRKLSTNNGEKRGQEQVAELQHRAVD